MREDERVVTTLARRSGRHPAWRAAVLVLRQAVPSLLVVLLAAGLLLGGLVVRGTWAGTGLTGLGLYGGAVGVANLVWLLLGLAALIGWARAVRTVVPVLVAGGITRRAVTDGLLVATVAIAAAVTVALAVVGVVGTALQRWLTALWQAPPPTADGSLYVSSMKIVGAAGGPTVYFAPGYTFLWFILLALAGTLLGAVWYRWRAGAALGLAVAMPVLLVGYWVVTPIVTSGAVDTFGGPLLLTAGLPCLVLVTAVWLVLRRVTLRPPAR